MAYSRKRPELGSVEQSRGIGPYENIKQTHAIDPDQDYLDKEAFHNKLEIKIQNLISPDNIGDSDSVKEFQRTINRYVYGDDKLRVDGQWGKNTNQALLDYRWTRKHWFGNSETWDIDARRTYDSYQTKSNEKMGRVKKHINPGRILNPGEE